MSDWAGFTEADIKRMKHGENLKDTKPKINKSVTKSFKRNPQHTTKPTNVGKQSMQKDSSNVVPAGACLSKIINPQPLNNVEKKREIQQAVPQPNNNGTKQIKTNDVVPTSQDEKIQTEIILDEEIIQKKEKLKLEDVHIRQKQMEERNRRKREMLTKEIKQRKKKASDESNKLLNVQAELSKLDQMLNCDVSILRDKIEESCWSFMNAQKRFQKAEAEYIASKMDLHHKTEIKEDLTEHLFSLIQANEERKAKKLEELMLKLNVEDEDLEAKEEKEEMLREEKKEAELKIRGIAKDKTNLDD